MFNYSTCKFIEKMGMDSKEYYNLISNQFSQNIKIFENMISFFMVKQKIIQTEFNSYLRDNGIDKNEDCYESLYDLFCCLKLFISYGKFELYKVKDPEWNVPRVVLNRSDFQSAYSMKNHSAKFIYRGMSKEEFDNGTFGQSWTLSLETARLFAKLNYNQPDGLVVKAPFKFENILHITDELPEYEVIVEQGAIKKSLVGIVNI